MSLIDALFSPRLLLAIGVFFIVSLLVDLGGRRLLDHLSVVPISHWLLTHGLFPAARSLALVAFILLAYPTLFGLEQAPPLSELLAARGRVASLVNLSFLLSLLLPFVPLIGQIPALVLPLQGIAAASLLFHWWAASIPPQSIDFWPDWRITAALLLLAYAGHAAARGLAQAIARGQRARFDAGQVEELAYRSLLMALQAPVILLYTLVLGRQIQF